MPGGSAQPRLEGGGQSRRRFFPGVGSCVPNGVACPSRNSRSRSESRSFTTSLGSSDCQAARQALSRLLAGDAGRSPLRRGSRPCFWIVGIVVLILLLAAIWRVQRSFRIHRVLRGTSSDRDDCPALRPAHVRSRMAGEPLAGQACLIGCSGVHRQKYESPSRRPSRQSPKADGMGLDPMDGRSSHTGSRAARRRREDQPGRRAIAGGTHERHRRPARRSSRADGMEIVRWKERIGGPAHPPWRDPHVLTGQVAASFQVPNSGRRDESWDWSRWMIDECIWETRDSLRSSVAPISFMVKSS